MRHTFDKITSKPQDYKICDECNTINWYENEECHNCTSVMFGEKESQFEAWEKEEREFWKEEYQYSEKDLINIEYGV